MRRERIVALAARFWAGFQRFFGLNVCTPAAPPQAPLSEAQRRTQERLQGLLHRD